MSEWKECKLGAIADIQTGPFGSQLHMSDYKSKGTPIITVEHLGDNKIIHDNLPLVGDDDRERLIKYTLEEGDIVFSRVGSVDRRAFVTNKEAGWMFSGRCLRVRPNIMYVVSKYLSYYFGQENFKENIRRIAVGATMPSINTTILNDVDVSIPSLPEQKAIAGVLSSLDDKIDLLHRQNKTLEAMAEALFRQWFVEEASDDWEKKPLTCIADFLNGLACQKYPPQNDIDKLPVLKIRELSTGISDSSDWVTTNINNEYIIETGDIIFAWSASLMVKIWDGKKVVLNQHLFKVSSEKYPKWFYYMWCRYYLEEFISISTSHATTMGHIKRNDLDNAMVLIPSGRELNKMTEIIKPIIDKIISNYKRLMVVKKLRDTLLPKLMSGEVRVEF